MHRSGEFIVACETVSYLSDSQWYAVWTRSRQEKAAATMLGTLGIQHFLPLKDERRQWSDRRQTVQLPLFAGYLFVRINPLKDSKLQILKTPGVVGLVSNNIGPLPIPDEQIESIRTVLSCGVEYTELPILKTGDKVRVTCGALAGVEGTLIRCQSETRLIISIDMIQRSIAVNVSRQDVEPVMTHAA
jgi:transcriptional antiterminator NusG